MGQGFDSLRWLQTIIYLIDISTYIFIVSGYSSLGITISFSLLTLEGGPLIPSRTPREALRADFSLLRT